MRLPKDTALENVCETSSETCVIYIAFYLTIIVLSLLLIESRKIERRLCRFVSLNGKHPLVTIGYD